MSTPKNTPPPSFLRRASPFMKKNKKGAKTSPFVKRNLKPSTRKLNPQKSMTVKKEEDVDLSLDKYQQFSITACTADEIKNIKYHVMKLQSKKEVNPVKDFVQPMRLHRKDPQNMSSQLTLKEIDEREKMNRELMASKKLSKDINTKAVVDLASYEGLGIPDEGSVAPESFGRRIKHRTRKLRTDNEEGRKLRYEEYYPWIIEDYDGSNTYVGAYEAGTSSGHNHALLIPTAGGFKLVPIDKIYKFTPRNKYATFTLDEAEDKMSKWNSIGFKRIKPEESSDSNARRRFKTVASDDMLFGDEDRDGSDAEDMDYEAEFADDEEAPIVGENDEEEKETKKKMKKEMLGANTGLDSVVDDDIGGDSDVEGRKKKVDKEGKKIKKALRSTQYGQFILSDSEDENPYLSDSDLESSSSDKEIKKEDDGSLSKASSLQPSAPKLWVKTPVNNNPVGVVTIAAVKQILLQFPKGEWSPEVSRKRALSGTSLSSKGHKRQKSKAASPETSANEASTSILGSPQPKVSLTEHEIVELVKNNELTFKDLCSRLKHKLANNSANKKMFKSCISKLVKTKTGADGTKILILKNPNV